jgi:Arc/MetJ family transcription regulator
MSRTNIDIDDDACERVMRMYHLDTKREAVNLALRKLAHIEPMSLDEVLDLQGIWADRPSADFEDLDLGVIKASNARR